jgi:hypothetical protein
VYNLHGGGGLGRGGRELIRERNHGAKALVTYDAGTEVPVAGAYNDAAVQRDLGPLPRTSLRDGVSQTMERFERLLREGGLDVRELA